MSQENVEHIRRLYAEWAKGSFGTTADYFDPKVEFQWFWPAAQWTALAHGVANAEGRVHGLDQLYGVWRDWLKTWEWFTVEAEKLIDVDDRALVLYRRRARMRGTDSTIEQEDRLDNRAGGRHAVDAAGGQARPWRRLR
jgi:hypothetical protein